MQSNTSLIVESKYPIENYGTSCSTEYSLLFENAMYGLQALYLIPTLVFLLWILFLVRIRHREQYWDNIWFWMLTIDCVAGIILILLDLLITRLFLYFPQFCPFFSKIFISYPLINHIYFPLYNYVRAIKPVTQCAMMLLRLSCVVNVGGYQKMWTRKIVSCCVLTCLLPFLVIWNTIISKKQVVFWRGGFFVIYHRYVQWASLSMLHTIFLLIAILILLLTSIQISRKLIKLQLDSPKDVPPQRKICVYSAFISVGFFLQAAFQSYYALFRHAWWFPSLLVDFQFVIYDVLTVGSPILIVNTSTELYNQMFNSKKLEEEEQKRQADPRSFVNLDTGYLENPRKVDRWN